MTEDTGTSVMFMRVFALPKTQAQDSERIMAKR